MEEEFTKNIKYQQIVKVGKNLFWKYGIKKVSVEEISKEAKVSKVTFYKFFKNKIELAKAIVTDLVEKPLKEYKLLIHGEQSFTDKINRMLKMKLEGTKDVSAEFINDIYKNPAYGLMEYLNQYAQQSLALTLEFIKNSQQKGHIRKDIKIEFVMYFFNKMLEMTTDSNLIQQYEKPEDLIMEVTEFFFYGIGAKK